MVVGKKTWQEWQKETGWKPYPDDRLSFADSMRDRLLQLQKERDATFLIFGASWCPDTESQLPRIMRIMETSSIPSDRVILFEVDRHLTEPTGTAGTFAIQRIPTLIILVKGEEIGRIVEFPEVSWEDDLIAVLSR